MAGHVLLVEDNPTNRYLARYLLEMAGCTVDEAADGAQALQAVRRRRPDLILMDLRMPVMDGYEATRAIKADAALQAIPVVALSAHAQPQDRARSLEAGCIDHIGKPIDLDTFLPRLRRLVPDLLG